MALKVHSNAIELEYARSQIKQLQKRNEELAQVIDNDTNSDFLLTPNNFNNKSRNSLLPRQDRSDQTPFEKITRDIDLP